MPDKPVAEVEISEELVRALIRGQGEAIPGAASLPLVHAADGWDCSVWRLGERYAVRLPRRAVAAPLVVHEQLVLGGIAARLVGTGVGVPAPIVNGQAANGYPWPWSIVPWFDGRAGLGIPRADRGGWAVPLARALLALHVIAPADHPVNPVRGVPLSRRSHAVEERFERVVDRAGAGRMAPARAVWDAALNAPAWDEPPVWIHGDLHPGNLIAAGPTLVAIIDFGDVTGGDPAYDLAVAWLAFDAHGRAAFRSAIGDRYDGATWTRAHGWAAAVALMLLDQSDDNPDYARLGAEALAGLAT